MGLIAQINGWFRSKIVGWLESGGDSSFTDRSYSMVNRREYRLGAQRRFLRLSREGFDDNVVGNFLGLALDRAVSLLMGKEVEFEWEEGTPEEVIQFIDDIWEANNKPILLHKMALYGGEDGTVFVKLIPDYEKGWRILAQDPIFKDIVTDPDDDERVISYITQYKTQGLDGQEVARRETVIISNYEAPEQQVTSWIIRNEVSSRETGGKWRVESEEVWPYPLPPIIHWKNLPMLGTVWGMPDVSDDVMELQDKSNFAISNINRIIRLFAHPQRWSKFFGGRKVAGKGGDAAELDVGPDSMPNSDNVDAVINQLSPVGDVPGATGHAQNLRQIIFDLTRNMDISSMKDKVGGLTNFGLRILYFDALNKLDTKRYLYGWGLREINRRLQMFSNLEPWDCDIYWQDPLPKDETALRQNIQADLNMGVVSKQTAAERLGYDWDDEKIRMQEEQAAGDNVGAMLLRAFERTGGGVQPNEFAQRQPVQGNREL
jgi:hypothetical protein